MRGKASIERTVYFLLATIITALIFCVSCSGGTEDGRDQDAVRAKSVILFVGDGMGAAHHEAIKLSTSGLEGNSAMDSLAYSGLSHTSSADPEDFVTDSAAAATALASGVKTYNGAVGVDADGEPVTTILEEAQKAGKSTGIVTTSTATDATPAAFAAHVFARTNQNEIARQYIEETGPDVILGGGGDLWHSESREGSGGNLVEQAERSGYEYVADPNHLESTQSPKILGLFTDGAMFLEGTEGEGIYDPAVSLPTMTDKAIETLSQDDDGFFLVVEEEAIDAMSHANNGELALKAAKRLDEAVSLGRTYAEENPDTLVIVTADHETGGLGIEGADGSDDGPFRVAGTYRQAFEMGWTTTEHTADSVPVTAEGPGAEKLVGVYENTHVYDVMKEALLGAGKGGG